MRGWLFIDTFVPPELIEREDPKVVPGEVIVDIKASGICHSDVGALYDPSFASLRKGGPIIFGHECAGVISEIGEGVTEWKVGDRVGVVPQDPNNPLAILGGARDGGYATKILVPAYQCVKLPDEVSYIQGAVGTDAGATTYRALFTIGKAKAGMKVGIIGVGGLGQFAVQMANIAGCEVYAADMSEEARALAESLGCKKVYSDANELKNDNLELILDFAGFDVTLTAAVNAVIPGGTVVEVGLGQMSGEKSSKVGMEIGDLVLKEVTVKGSLGNTKDDIAGVYQYFATGKLKPQLEIIKFEEIGEGLERLHRGEVRGRLAAEVNG